MVLTRPGLIDVITSFPVLIIMIVMKKTDHVAAWIVKLPAFRIYILRSRVVLPSPTSPHPSSPHVPAS